MIKTFNDKNKFQVNQLDQDQSHLVNLQELQIQVEMCYSGVKYGVVKISNFDIIQIFVFKVMILDRGGLRGLGRELRYKKIYKFCLKILKEINRTGNLFLRKIFVLMFINYPVNKFNIGEYFQKLKCVFNLECQDKEN